MRFQSNLNVIIESNIRALVLLNLLNSLRKKIKCSAILSFYLLSQTRLINSIKHEHSCKILYAYRLIFHFCRLLIFFKINFFNNKKILREYYQCRLFVGLDLDPHCLQRLSADDARRQRNKDKSCAGANIETSRSCFR